MKKHTQTAIEQAAQQTLDRAARIERIVKLAKEGYRELRKLSLVQCIHLLMQHADFAAHQKGKKFKRLKGRVPYWKELPGHVQEAADECGLYYWAEEQFRLN